MINITRAFSTLAVVGLCALLLAAIVVRIVRPDLDFGLLSGACDGATDFTCTANLIPLLTVFVGLVIIFGEVFFAFASGTYGYRPTPRYLMENRTKRRLHRAKKRISKGVKSSHS